MKNLARPQGREAFDEEMANTLTNRTRERSQLIVPRTQCVMSNKPTRPNPTTQTRLLRETFDQIDLLRSILRTFDSGDYQVYKSIAVVLRTLLLGSSGYRSLVDETLPSLKLSPLRIQPDASIADRHFVLPTETVVSSGGATVRIRAGAVVQNLIVAGSATKATSAVESFLDSGVLTLSYQDWLGQPFLRAAWTIKDFILAIAHKDGGAHVGRSEIVDAMESWGHYHWRVLATLAREIEPEIRLQLRKEYPTYLTPER